MSNDVLIKECPIASADGSVDPFRSIVVRRIQVSLAPGFSRVNERAAAENRFNGFSRGRPQAAEAAGNRSCFHTRLKPGANVTSLFRLRACFIPWALGLGPWTFSRHA
jgi:hypothetical protein